MKIEIDGININIPKSKSIEYLVNKYGMRGLCRMAGLNATSVYDQIDKTDAGGRATFCIERNDAVEVWSISRRGSRADTGKKRGK